MKKMMKQLDIYVDWVPNNFSAAPVNEEIACVATGHTLADVEKNIVDALKFHVEGLMEDGESVPEDLKGEWTPVFHLLSIQTGINEQQLSHYANGQRKPRPAMQRRIQDGIRAIAMQLSSVF